MSISSDDAKAIIHTGGYGSNNPPDFSQYDLMAGAKYFGGTPRLRGPRYMVYGISPDGSRSLVGPEKGISDLTLFIHSSTGTKSLR